MPFFQDEEIKNPSLYRILVIDDELPILKLVKLILTRAHYEVITCENSDDAFKAMEENFFDCIITDAMMPQLSGFDLIRILRHHPMYKDLPILMLTKKRQPQDVEQAIQAGVSGYIIKPIDQQILLDKVELCLKKGNVTRHTFELEITGPNGNADVEFNSKIVKFSETALTLELPFSMLENVKFNLKGQIFDQIGIQQPHLRFLKSTELSANPPLYQSQFLFVGVQEADLKKSRVWLQKEAIRTRRK